MNDETRNEAQSSSSSSSRHVPLEVLPHSGKVEQLKREVQADAQAGLSPPASKKLADQNLIDRALDPNKTPAQKSTQEKVIDVVRTVFDPEIPVNIYDLGLIYDISVSPENRVHVKMTLTAPGCPVAGTLPVEVERKIENIPEVTSATVELVWDPPWTRERMSEAALLDLGLA
jgi:FeS assembly SUF system protein